MKKLIIILFLLWPCIVHADDNLQDKIVTVAQQFCESDKDVKLLIGYFSFYRLYMFKLPDYCSQKGVLLKYPQDIMRKYENKLALFLQDFKKIKCHKDFLRGIFDNDAKKTNLLDEFKLWAIRFLKDDYQSTDDDLTKFKDLFSDEKICEFMEHNGDIFEDNIKKYIIDMY